MDKKCHVVAQNYEREIIYWSKKLVLTNFDSQRFAKWMQTFLNFVLLEENQQKL